MALIGELAVNVVARTGGMSAGLNRAQKDLKRFQGVASNIAAGIAGAFSIYAIRGMINDFADLGDMFDKMSQRTGVSVEALSGLKFAAEQSGASIETVETGIRNMQRVLLDVQQGSTTAAKTLQMLGLNINELKTLSPEQQFLEMAQAIAGVEDPSRQAALAMELFGRSGTQLLPMLRQGEAGIEQLMAEAKRLGIVMSEEDAKAAADFTDAMNRLSKVFQGIATQLASVITPLLTKLSNTFTSLDSGTRTLVVNIGLFSTAFLGALMIIPKVIGIFKMLIGAYRALATAQAIQQALSGPKGWAVLAASAVVAGVAVAGVAYAMDDLNSTVADLEQGAEQVASGALPEVGNSAAKNAAKARERLSQVRSEIEQINANLKKTQRSFDSITGQGSQSAFESIIKFQRNPQEATFQRASLRALEKQEALLERIVENTEEIADNPPVQINEVSAF